MSSSPSTRTRARTISGGGLLELDLGFLSADEARACFDRLLGELELRQGVISMFGRDVAEPRLTAWHGDRDATYTYSGRLNIPRPWTPELLGLRARVEARAGTRFNAVLVNLYRSGQDSMGLHADDERELGPEPTIASLSLGATRRFVLKPKEKGRADPITFDLTAGSLLIMSGKTQASWKHAIPKQRGVETPRLNLTFRRVYSSGHGLGTRPP